MKIFAQVKSKHENKHYSTYIEIDENGEVVDYGCTCVYGSFYMWSKKNGEGTKPCWHIKFLKEKYEKAKAKSSSKADSMAVLPNGN